jgi:hypothetical protein
VERAGAKRQSFIQQHFAPKPGVLTFPYLIILNHWAAGKKKGGMLDLARECALFGNV